MPGISEYRHGQFWSKCAQGEISGQSIKEEEEGEKSRALKTLQVLLEPILSLRLAY